MLTVTEKTLIARPAAEVFDFLTDGQNRPQWDTTVISEELTSSGPLGVGSTLHTHMRAVGREVEFDWRLEQFERPSRMTLVSTSGPLATSFLLTFTDVGGSCEVSATIDAEPSGMMRLVEPMIAEGVRSNLATGLARAKAVLEARPLS